MSTPRTGILIGLLLIVALIVAGAAIRRHQSIPAGLFTAAPQIQTTYWENRMHAAGAVKAYAEFAEAVKALSPEKQHPLAHSFGAALFAVEGTGGLSVCDARFSFGCFHEFLGRAIAALGLDSVPALSDGCEHALSSDPLSCKHGIGHGILAYVGYSSDDLGHALSVCKEISATDPIGGCYGGVFMEYNLQTMLGPEGRIRPATADMQAPCDRVASIYKTACYFWQPQWWRQHFRNEGMLDDERAYAAVGALCAQVPAKYSRTCYEGIGNVAPSDALYDGVRTRQLCEQVSSDPRAQLYCKSLAADSLFVGGAGAKGDAASVCEGLPDDQYRYCMTYANNTANIAVPLKDPAH